MDSASSDSVKPHFQRSLSLLNDGVPIKHDVTFLVGSPAQEVRGHEFILRVHTPILATIADLRKASEARSHSGIRISGSATAFKRFLKFLYTGRFGEEEEDNAASLLEFALRYEVADLEKACTSFLERNAQPVLDSEEFLKFSEADLKEILVCDDLAARNETQVFEAVLRWAEERVRSAELEGKPVPLSSVIKDLLQLIRFIVMNASDFALIVVPKNILTKGQITLAPNFNSNRQRRWYTPPEEHLPSTVEHILTRLSHKNKPPFELSRQKKLRNYGIPHGAVTHQIMFRVRQALWISSVGLNGGRLLPEPQEHNYDQLGTLSSVRHLGQEQRKVKCCAKVIERSTGHVVASVDTAVTSIDREVRQIEFPSPRRLKSDVWYIIKMTIPTGSYVPDWRCTPNGDDGRAKTLRIGGLKEHVTMDFDEVLPLEFPCVTGLQQGLIPSIGFKLDAI